MSAFRMTVERELEDQVYELNLLVHVNFTPETLPQGYDPGDAGSCDITLIEVVSCRNITGDHPVVSEKFTTVDTEFLTDREFVDLRERASIEYELREGDYDDAN